MEAITFAKDKGEVDEREKLPFPNTVFLLLGFKQAGRSHSFHAQCLYFSFKEYIKFHYTLDSY